jgi:hypothetical protein
MENKIPTAEEFLWNGTIITQGDTEPYGRLPNDKVPLVMIEFAKLHVEAALKKAAEIVEMEVEKDFLTKDVILNAYPLTNIK